MIESESSCACSSRQFGQRGRGNGAEAIHSRSEQELEDYEMSVTEAIDGQ